MNPLPAFHLPRAAVFGQFTLIHSNVLWENADGESQLMGCPEAQLGEIAHVDSTIPNFVIQLSTIIPGNCAILPSPAPGSSSS